MFLALMAAFAVATSYPAAQAPALPTFHASTHLVQINVVVKDKSGPVSNLTRDDFAVSDQGRPQTISAFSLNANAASAAAPQPLPKNTFSDLPLYTQAVPNGVTVLLLDNLNTLVGSEQNYEDTPFWTEELALANGKQHLVDYVQHLAPADRVALYSLRDSLHVLCDFTCGREQLLALLKTYDTSSKTRRDTAEPGPLHFPQQPEAGVAASVADVREAQFANQARAEQTMAALQAIAAHLAQVPGRKNLLWLTANLPFSAEAIARVCSRATIAVYPIDVRGLLPRTVGRTAADIYDADETITGSVEIAAAQKNEPIGIATMEKIAEQTGGRAFVNTNNLTDAIRQAVDDSAVSYTLGFYVSPESLDGKFHELKVALKRSGVTVRYPRTYFAAQDAPAEMNQRRSRLAVAVRSPLQASAIPVFARFEKPGQPKADSLRVVGNIDIRKLQFAEASGLHTAAVDIVVVQQDIAGKVLKQSGSTLQLRFTPEHFAAAQHSGVLFQESIEPLPGLATLRVVVEDAATAETGSIIVAIGDIQ